jgi:hypothetical protein
MLEVSRGHQVDWFLNLQTKFMFQYYKQKNNKKISKLFVYCIKKINISQFQIRM